MSTAQREESAAGRLSLLPTRLAQRADFVDLIGRLEPGREAPVDGVWGSVRALLAAALARGSNKPLLVVAPRPADMEQVADDLILFDAANVAQIFPPHDERPVEETATLDEEFGQRVGLLKRLIAPRPKSKKQTTAPPIIVTCIQAMLQGVPARADLDNATRRLAVGEPLDLEELLDWLVARGFQGTSAVELPGEFAIRGGILDLYPVDADDPIRIETFGDEIESIRRFSVADQRSLGTSESIDITAIDSRVAAPDHLANYLPPDTLVLLIEAGTLDREGRQFIERSAETTLHTVADVFRGLYRFPIITGEPLVESALGDLGECLRLPIQSVDRFSGEIERVRDELDTIGGKQDVVIVCQTEAESRRLAELFATTHIATSGRLHFVLGRLHNGFRLMDEPLVVISGGELFGRSDIARPVRKHASRVIESFLDLREGDLVVHLAHGIARYRGLKQLDRAHGKEEHLELEFDGGTKVFVPATKINLVQKYVGGKKSVPTLAKIGGKSWVKQKEAAWSAVTDLASDMLEVQAGREARPGIRFAGDTIWQQEFDASFPYRETTDQLTSIEAIKNDMQRPRPMDRLLCGDVGFGKTELALRAAFKAVDNGYQVAILAPTTVLVEQHYRTFTQRMAEFPFQIARLSRFCTTREQNDIIAELELGTIDIVIGTHRLASPDVKFNNLGLLVIDEEQRFGVEVKERLKALRQTVDVLTMTATPIPRTLHMSLLGLRDISNLETPPDDRIAVETRVVRWDDRLIRQAILRELNRGGQVYFVHNRIADIANVAHKLHELVPDARYTIGHGQMPEGVLEQVMLDFVDHRSDVLVATTIIESGLDIPNANTIFIDEAHRYGLADLHQLRGRVGRYKHRAYCYLLVEPHRQLTPDAARRLRAIEEYSRLGAGFAIAMRDLEIRGAGNILGTQQSGHIAAVGYELYCQMLEQAVRRQRQLPPSDSPEVDIDLPVSALIPPAYVGDLRLKIDLYRRLARVPSLEQLEAIAAELVDRFGPRPPEVDRLLLLAELRLAAANWRVDALSLEPPYLVLAYSDRRRIEQLAAKHPKKVLRVVDDRCAYHTLDPEQMNPDGILAAVKALLIPKPTSKAARSPNA